jgi:hypothetical protein
MEKMKNTILAFFMSLALGCSTSSGMKHNAQPVTPPAPVAAPTPAMDPELVMTSCHKADETRTLQVEKKNNGCVLEYTKPSGKKSVASSSHGLKHCVATKDKIIGKLKNTGYTCE